MATTKTNSNPNITHGDDDEWVAATITRIDANIAELRAVLAHQDGLIHEIHQALAPLREHPDAIARGMRMLDSKHLPAWMTGKRKD